MDAPCPALPPPLTETVMPVRSGEHTNCVVPTPPSPSVACAVNCPEKVEGAEPNCNVPKLIPLVDVLPTNLQDAVSSKDTPMAPESWANAGSPDKASKVAIARSGEQPEDPEMLSLRGDRSFMPISPLVCSVPQDIHGVGVPRNGLRTAESMLLNDGVRLPMPTKERFPSPSGHCCGTDFCIDLLFGSDGERH